MGIFKPHVRYSRCNGETDIKTGRTPRFGYWLLVTCCSYYPTPRRALRDTPRPPQITTHANFVCAGPGVGRWALVRFRRGTKFPSAEGWRDTGPRENAIFVGGRDGVVRDCGISYLLSCHSRLNHPINTFVFAGTPGAGMTMAKSLVSHWVGVCGGI